MAKKEKTKKLSSNGKKALVLCCMVALLVVTGVLNYVLNTQIKDNDDNLVNGGNDGTAVETFFSSHRSNRETARAEEFSYLDAIISSESTSESVKASAQDKQVELLSFIEKELVLESLIKAKGFEDAVVTMSTNNLNVIVKQAELTREEVAQILGTILQETDYVASQIYVVPYTA
ncbi:MAG: SpoIIIAH-like family protein [Clostridia bacterium]|nr:SpoIIIAH-like family protein [Clostridia bacterium]MDE7337488.1 SpoIIIAH-like family protein [Clostridia bacterium]